MGPNQVPFRTGCAKITKFSISKTLVYVGVQEQGGETAKDIRLVRCSLNYSVQLSLGNRNEQETSTVPEDRW